MTNKEKFLALVTEKDTSFLKELNERTKNREMLRESQTIAFKILFRLDELGWSQIDLANLMKVKPQQINKIVKGTENLTIDTIVKLQRVLNISILASHLEKVQAKLESDVIEMPIQKEKIAKQPKANYSDKILYRKRQKRVINLFSSKGNLLEYNKAM